MPQYRKKPVVIDAIQFIGVADGRLRFASDADWLEEATGKLSTEPGALYRLNDSAAINTLEGPLQISPEDYVIRGVKGELYPCKPDIFVATYDTLDAA